MADNFRKYWFVGLIGAILVAGIGYYTKTQIDAIFTGKTVDGKDVVFAIDGTDVFADEYYDLLFQSSLGTSELYTQFERLILSAIATDEDIAVDAKLQAETYIRNISASSGTAGLNSLNESLISMGYSGTDEFYLYYEDLAKKTDLIREFLRNNYEEYVQEYYEEKSPRTVSHILITMTDSENPTEDEIAKMDAVDAALAEGKSFSDVAIDHSLDTDTAATGGDLGFMDADTSYQTEFLETALALAEGEVSEWITTSYGKHRILVTTVSFADLLNVDDFINAMLALDTAIMYNAIWEAAATMDIEFASDEIRENLLAYMGLDGESE